MIRSNMIRILFLMLPSICIIYNVPLVIGKLNVTTKHGDIQILMNNFDKFYNQFQFFNQLYPLIFSKHGIHQVLLPICKQRF